MLSIKKTLAASVLLACVFFFYIYIRDHLSDFACISEISPAYVALIACASLASLVVNGFFLKALTTGFGIDLNFLEYFSISIVTSFGNLFLPMKGGAGFRAVYLKSRYNFNYTYFLSSLGATYLIAFNITPVAALACMTILYFNSGGFSVPVALIFLAVAVATSWAIFLPPRDLEWLPPCNITKRAGQVLSGWHIMRKSPKTVANLFRLAALNLLIGSVATWLEFAAFNMKDPFGNGIGFLQSAVFTAIGSLSFLAGITPAALGIKESLLMFSSQFLGISPSQALTVSLLDRSVSVLVLCIFFGFASVHLKRKISSGRSGDIPATSLPKF